MTQPNCVSNVIHSFTNFIFYFPFSLPKHGIRGAYHNQFIYKHSFIHQLEFKDMEKSLKEMFLPVKSNT